MGGSVRMIVLARKGGDEQFVEAVRKNLLRPRLSRWTQGVLGLLFVAVGIGVPLGVYYFARLRVPDADTPLGQATVAGLVAGAVGGASVILGVKAIRDAFIFQPDNRLAKLMLQYHDQIQSQPTPPAEPPPSSDI